MKRQQGETGTIHSQHAHSYVLYAKQIQKRVLELLNELGKSYVKIKRIL
jgi:hypothetical protein